MQPPASAKAAAVAARVTHSRDAARLQPGQAVVLPEAPLLHLFVPRGSVTLEGAGALATGDAVRFAATGGQKVTAIEPAAILVWEMHAALAASQLGLGLSSDVRFRHARGLQAVTSSCSTFALGDVHRGVSLHECGGESA